MRARFAFIVEQTLGHTAHTRNLELALATADWIESAVVKLPFEPSTKLERLPGLRNWSLRASLATRRALRRSTKLGTVDAAFIHTQVAALLSVGIMQSLPTVISLDATPRNFDDVGEAYSHRRGHVLAERAKASVNQRAFQAAAALVAWSRLAADSLVSDYGVRPSRIHVIPPGVDVKRFQPRAMLQRDGPVRVLFVGGDFVRKGGLDLLAAMRGVPGTELDVVTGSEVGKLPPDLCCRVHRGFQPGEPQLLDLYHRADLFAMPTRGDCLPQALAEAAAAGLPLVSTVTGAVPEVVKNGRNGFLVPVGDVDQLRDVLRRLVGRPELRQALGRESLKLARREHDAYTNHRRIFELMADLAQPGHAPNAGPYARLASRPHPADTGP